MAKGIYYKLPSTLLINKPIEIIINEIRDLLINSVNKRLMSDRPIGALLSGGLDSSIISSIISKKVSNLTTFSIGLENSPDLIKAQEVANYIKSTHHSIEMTINEMINSYHVQFIGNQIQRIDATLDLINQRRIPDKPTRQQLRLAMEWCKKYEIKINKGCIYLH